jgi:hypothetical protein
MRFKLITRSFPMLLASGGLMFLATGFGNLTLGQTVNSIWNNFQTMSHQPLTTLIDTSNASGLINMGLFLIAISAIVYLAPKMVSKYN